MKHGRILTTVALAMTLALGGCGGGEEDGAGPDGGGGGSGDTTLLTVTNLSGAKDSVSPRQFTVPANATTLRVRTSGGTGDVDILVTGPSSQSCTSDGDTNAETCDITTPAAGSWQVQLIGFGAYSGVTLLVTAETGTSNGGGSVPAASGLTQLSSTALLPGNFTAAGGKVFFVTREDPPFTPRLWMSDGTAAGTRQISATLQPGPLVALGQGVMFSASDAVSGVPGVYFADAAGDVRLVKATPATPGSVSGATLIGVFGTRLFFVGDDGVNGRELWSSDGTTAGTNMVANIDTNGDALLESRYAWTWWNGKLYFYAAADENTDIPQLYSTTGAAGNLTQLTFSSDVGAVLLNYDMAVFNGKLYFTWRSPAGGVELWSTDGTYPGTQVFFDAMPATGMSGWPTKFNVVGGKLLFSAYYPGGNGTHKGLFASDGTSAGTTRISTVDMGLFTDDMVTVNGKYLFPGRLPSSNLYTLWTTDGTSAGTTEVSAAVQPADDRFDGDISGRGTALLGSKLVFLGRDTNSGYEPWVTDGTSAGTVRLADLNAGTGSSFGTNVNNGWIATHGTKAYFTADVGNSDFRLYETDGTGAGTREVKPSNATVTSNTRGDSQTTLAWAPFSYGSRLLFGARYFSTGAASLFVLNP